MITECRMKEYLKRVTYTRTQLHEEAGRWEVERCEAYSKVAKAKEKVQIRKYLMSTTTTKTSWQRQQLQLHMYVRRTLK